MAKDSPDNLITVSVDLSMEYSHNGKALPPEALKRVAEASIRRAIELGRVRVFGGADASDVKLFGYDATAEYQVTVTVRGVRT